MLFQLRALPADHLSYCLKEGDDNEIKEVEKECYSSNGNAAPYKPSVLTGPVFKAFFLTLVAEFGDRSQVVTIG